MTGFLMAATAIFGAGSILSMIHMCGEHPRIKIHSEKTDSSAFFINFVLFVWVSALVFGN